MKLTGEVLGGKTCPSATLSTTNPTWTDAGSNPGLRGQRPATNRLSHGTADLSRLLSALNFLFNGSCFARAALISADGRTDRHDEANRRFSRLCKRA